MRDHYRIKTLVTLGAVAPIGALTLLLGHRLLAEDDLRAAASIAGLGALATAALAALVLRSLRRPLRRADARISALADGHANTTQVGGPTEFRTIDAGLDRLTAVVDLLSAQTTHLAAGELHAAALEHQVPGPAGTAVQKLRRGLLDIAARLDHEATRDRLTHLLDRTAGLAAIEDALVRAERDDSSVAIVFVDVDGLKSVNEGPGHAVGDALLIDVAERLRETVGTEDPIARIDGDEFVIVMDNLYDVGEAVRLSGRVLERLRQPYSVEGHTLSLTASIGVAWSPQAQIKTADLLSHAELAVQRAKASGTGGADLFDEHLQRAVNRRQRVERGLDTAISDGQLELWYQPVFETAGSKVWGTEALVRWLLPDGKILPPEKFVPVAEQSDLILQLERFVMDEACSQLATWRQDPEMAAMRVSVNISARHLQLGQIERTVAAALAASELPGDALVIEISERQLDDLTPTAVGRLQYLRDLGIGVALDNFGASHASVAALKRLPLTHVKIDGSLARSRSDVDHSILESLARISATLGVSVVAQGIESPEQLDLATSLGFSHAQGYLLTEPMAAGDLWPWLRHWQAPERTSAAMV